MQPVLDMVIWIYIFDCLPLTVLVICFVGCVVKRDQVPVVYYANLIFAVVIQMCAFNMTQAKPHDSVTSVTALAIYLLGVMAGLYFKLYMALESYFIIVCPLLDYMRQTKGSVLVCVLVWVLCVVSVPREVLLHQFEHIFIFGLFPAPLFIFCLAGTLKALPAATSVPTEEKRRIVGTLIVLLLHYFLIIVPTIILIAFELQPFDGYIICIFFLLSSFEVLILFVFMRNACTDTFSKSSLV